MTYTTSLLSLLKKEDALLEELDIKQDESCELLHENDDLSSFYKYYGMTKDEVDKKYSENKEAVMALYEREEEIRKELKEVRGKIRRYLARNILSD